jgi:lipopolysaccharide/colanic/teichoic acid biosynthesis glycosyltransferase
MHDTLAWLAALIGTAAFTAMPLRTALILSAPAATIHAFAQGASGLLASERRGAQASPSHILHSACTTALGMTAVIELGVASPARILDIWIASAIAVAVMVTIRRWSEYTNDLDELIDAACSGDLRSPVEGGHTSSPWRRRAKRSIDVVGAAMLLLVSSPVTLLCVVVVKLTSSGPVLFQQQRVGEGGRLFTLYKIRSMTDGAADHIRADQELFDRYRGNGFKCPPAMADNLVTTVGRFLRTTSLDELPQLWNVIRGDMSIVGPRPVVPEEFRLYGMDAHHYAAVKPGITGSWQVSGRSNLDHRARVALDAHYATRWSIAFDAYLLARTVPAVLARDGAR